MALYCIVDLYTGKSIQLTENSVIGENESYTGTQKWALNKDGEKYKFYYGTSADSAVEGKYAAITAAELGLSFSENFIALKIDEDVYLNSSEWNFENQNNVDSVIEKLKAYWDGSLNTSSSNSSGTGNTGNSGNQGNQTGAHSGYSVWYGTQKLVTQEYAMPLDIFVESFGLIKTTDYTVDETNKKILLTEAGFSKFMSMMQ